MNSWLKFKNRHTGSRPCQICFETQDCTSSGIIEIRPQTGQIILRTAWNFSGTRFYYSFLSHYYTKRLDFLVRLQENLEWGRKKGQQLFIFFCRQYSTYLPIYLSWDDWVADSHCSRMKIAFSVKTKCFHMCSQSSLSKKDTWQT